MAPNKATKSPDDLLHNVHLSLMDDREIKNFQVQTVKGKYSYYHYLCDGVDDRGWGCGYRTLQTICSWIYYRKEIDDATLKSKKCDKMKYVVPSISEVQQALVAMGDKNQSFINSKEWIGSVEISMCIDYFYDVSCRIVHIRPGDLGKHIQMIFDHFHNYGGVIMMGGDSDSSSKGILGVASNNKDNSTYLLILDPHCSSTNHDLDLLVEEKWISWRRIDTFDKNSFYNLCFPLLS